MAGEPHEVVKLLLARMESHPEEFRIGDGVFHLRWSRQIDMIHDHGREADKAALNAKLRDIIMDEVHEQVLDELMNGPDKRRKEAEENDYERNLARSLRHMQQSQYAQANQALNQAYDFDLDKMVGVGTTSPSTKLTVGTVSSDVAPSILNSMRRMLK